MGQWTLGDGLEIDEAVYELRRDGEPVALEPQAFDVLVYLLHNRDRVVSKEELMDEVWGGRFVSETAVTSRIKQVRRGLGDDGHAQRYVRTQHGRGYRFVGTAAPVDQGKGPAAAGPTAQPIPSPFAAATPARGPVRYTISDGLHIAYQVSGGGETDIVLISGFVSHLEIDWDDPRHAYFLDRLGSMGRLIRFDKRGTGMSDRPPGVPDLEIRMHDVLAVMDAVGSERAVVCGYSEGGPMAILLASTHPERVSALVLYAVYARRIWAPDYPWAQTQEDRQAYTDLLVNRWDWEADLRMRCPSGDPAMQKWWARRMTAAATPGTIRAIMDMNSLIDVRDLLPSVRVPSLILHRLDDPMFHVEEARYLAQRIPDARLEVLEGGDHLPSGNPAQLIDALGPFIADVPRRQNARALAAIAAPYGDDAGQIVGVLAAAGGRARSAGAGDTVVLFDGPATAVRAGLDALRSGAGAGIGLAIADVSVRAAQVSGVGVDDALRLGRRAAPGELLLSPMATRLLSGSGITLERVDDVLPVIDEEGAPFRAVS